MNQEAENLRVFKFGGSSLGSPDMLAKVINRIREGQRTGPLAVVVSAMGDTTDRLLEAADHAAAGDPVGAARQIDQITDQTTATGLVVQRELLAVAPPEISSNIVEITPLVRQHLEELRTLLGGIALLREKTPQTLDLVTSFGERLSATIVANLLQAVGVDAHFLDARQWLVTDDSFGDAMVDATLTKQRLLPLTAEWRGVVPITTGFIGATVDGRTTTLGRNGSDYTATLLARGLDASEVVVWTDTVGVMTADPAIVADAYPLPRMSYMEALELASFGARMFHERTMIPLIESNIPMRIKSTAAPEEPGTLIDGEGDPDETHPTSVTSLERLALLALEWRSLSSRAKLAARVVQALARAKVTVWMENQAAHGQSTAIVVPVDEVEIATDALRQELARELERGDVEPLRVTSPVTLVTLVAEAMGQTPGVAGKFFHTLGGVGVNVLASVQGASSRSVSAVINAEETAVAVRTVHSAFNLAHQEVNLLILGKGTVGGHLLEQIEAQRPTLERHHDVRLEVAGIGDSQRLLFDESGLQLGAWSEQLNERGIAIGEDGEGDLADTLERLRRLPVPVLVDCTAADGMEQLYADAFDRGIHVVAANKKPLTIEWSRWQDLMSAARHHHRAYHYETTVGASLPVIDTLKNLVRTGDHVRLIEGSFSGTLGYLTNELMAGVPLSKAVRTARELGYTEPNPADDLAGLDVARKALILARELGYDVELDDVVVEPLVPAELLEATTIEAFFDALESHDAELSAKIEAMKLEGRVLRYLARVDPASCVEGKRCALEVGPTFIAQDHPATRLRGSEAFVAFTTDRHLEYPLIVQGSGAGGAVTAAGVLADVLRVAQTLRGR